MRPFLTLIKILALMSWPAVGWASETRIKVQKVHGPVVTVHVTGPVLPGEEYLLVPTLKKSDPPETRNHRLGLTFDYSALKSASADLEYNPTSIRFEGDYGWVRRRFEYGLILGYASRNLGFGGTTNEITGGLFADFNFADHRESQASFFGIGLRSTHSQINTAAGLSGLYRFTAFPSVFWKWFPFTSTTALRLDIGYYMENLRDSSSSEIKSTGPKSTAALLFYY